MQPGDRFLEETRSVPELGFEGDGRMPLPRAQDVARDQEGAVEPGLLRLEDRVGRHLVDPGEVVLPQAEHGQLGPAWGEEGRGLAAAHPAGDHDGLPAHVIEVVLAHLGEDPVDGLLEALGAAEPVAEAVDQVGEAGPAGGIGEGGVDQAVGARERGGGDCGDRFLGRCGGGGDGPGRETERESPPHPAARVAWWGYARSRPSALAL
mgnify:CR=1 FL=1